MWHKIYCINPPDALYCVLDTKCTPLTLTQNEREAKSYNYNIRRDLEKYPGSSSYSEAIVTNIFLT